jgi:hypothetical protein
MRYVWRAETGTQKARVIPVDRSPVDVRQNRDESDEPNVLVSCYGVTASALHARLEVLLQSRSPRSTHVQARDRDAHVLQVSWGWQLLPLLFACSRGVHGRICEAVAPTTWLVGTECSECFCSFSGVLALACDPAEWVQEQKRSKRPATRQRW